MNNYNPEDLLTAKEVGRIFRVDTTTVRRWMEQGSLPHILLPGSHTHKGRRIRKSTIDAILAGMGNDPLELPF